LYIELRVEKQLCKEFLDWPGRLVRAFIKHRVRFLKNHQKNCIEALLSPGAQAKADTRCMQSSLKIMLVEPHSRAEGSSELLLRRASTEKNRPVQMCMGAVGGECW